MPPKVTSPHFQKTKAWIGQPSSLAGAITSSGFSFNKAKHTLLPFKGAFSTNVKTAGVQVIKHLANSRVVALTSNLVELNAGLIFNKKNMAAGLKLVGEAHLI
jgi:hypothetical protein